MRDGHGVERGGAGVINLSLSVVEPSGRGERELEAWAVSRVAVPRAQQILTQGLIPGRPGHVEIVVCSIIHPRLSVDVGLIAAGSRSDASLRIHTLDVRYLRKHASSFVRFRFEQ
jgi:hypothetical protein